VIFDNKKRRQFDVRIQTLKESFDFNIIINSEILIRDNRSSQKLRREILACQHLIVQFDVLNLYISLIFFRKNVVIFILIQQIARSKKKKRKTL
jgi:hypothetical protein